MPLGPFEIDDEHWAKILLFIQLKAKQLGITHPQATFILFKKLWLLLNNQAVLDTFIDEQKLESLEARRDILDGERPGLDAAIQALKDKLGL